MYELTTREIVVRVEPHYLDDESAPEDGYYVWAYRVEIENCGTETIQLRTRHWQIFDGTGKRQDVHGDGVIGVQPVIGPGDEFSYQSGTPLTTPSGIMAGSYTVQTDKGEIFDIGIPTFSLDSPHDLGSTH